MIKLILGTFRYAFLILCILTFFLNSYAYSFFGFSSDENDTALEENNVETPESVTAGDPLTAVTDSSLEAQRQTLAREEKKIEELKEIQSSFLDKYSTDSELSQEDEEIEEVSTSDRSAPVHYQSDRTRPTYSSSYQLQNIEKEKEGAAPETDLSETVEKNIPIQQFAVDTVERKPVTDLYERKKPEPVRSFFGGTQKEPIQPAPHASRYSSGARFQKENIRKSETPFGSQKNEKVKFCKTCGRDYKADDPRIFCPRDGTPLKLKNK